MRAAAVLAEGRVEGEVDMTIRRRLHLLSVPLAMVGLASGLLFSVGTAAGPAGADDCVSRILVLSAMPLELDPILKFVQQESTPVVINGRYFVTGTLGRNKQPVILGLTGIGPVDARTTTNDAFAHYQCGTTGSTISGVVFSGTAGGAFIGSVYVPTQWTEDGTTFYPSYSPWLIDAGSATQGLVLEQTTPTGDPACVCALADGVQTPVTVQHTPAVNVGGNGLTSDPFNGHASPCTPGGSDIDSCVPCRELDSSQVDQTTAMAQGIPPLVDPGFVTANLQSPPPGTYVSSDEETAEVAKVAQQKGVPFIGFRAASDGPSNTPGSGGDPLMLPGFPAQFLVYKQLAADNAASAAIAFLASLPDN